MSEQDHPRRGLYFQNSKTAMEDAIRCGDIIKVASETPGQNFYAFKTYKVGSEHGKLNKQELTGNKKLTGNEVDALRRAFKGLNWHFDVKPDADVLDGKGRLISQVGELLKQAKQSQEKLAKEGKGIIATWTGDEEIRKDIKAKYGRCIAFSSQLSHISDLTEMPDGAEITKASFDKFMLEVATFTEDFNVLLQKAKAEKKARS